MGPSYGTPGQHVSRFVKVIDAGFGESESEGMVADASSVAIPGFCGKLTTIWHVIEAIVNCVAFSGKDSFHLRLCCQERPRTDNVLEIVPLLIGMFGFTLLCHYHLQV